MPIVRDGRNRVDEYRVEPIGSPPGPVLRVAAISEARMADFAAERARDAERRERAAAMTAASRARGAQRAGFVKGAAKPHQRTEEDPVPPRQQNGHHDAGTGRARQQVEAGREAERTYKRSPEAREHMRLAQLARYERRRAEKAAAPEPVIEPEGGEEGAPATAARFEAAAARPGALRVALGVQPAAQEVTTPDATLEDYPRPRRHLTEAELFAAYRGVRVASAEEAG